MSLCLPVLLLAATALAEVPVQLPDAAEPSAWEEVLDLAGLVPGAPGDGAWVRLEPEGDRWSLTVRDTQGQVSSQVVDPPTTYAERRALAFLAASLVEPLDLPEPEPEPPPVEPSARPEPASPEPEEPEPGPPGDPSFFYVPSPVLPREPALSPVVAAHAGLALRQGVAPAAQVALHLGVDLRAPVRLGLIADLTPTASLVWLEAEGKLWTADVSAWAWWRHPHLRLGAGAGAGSRQFAERGAHVGHLTVPSLAAEAVATLPVAGALSLEPVARVRQDLVGITLLEDLEPRGELGRTSFLLGLGLGVHLGTP